MTQPPMDPLLDDPLTEELERALAVDHSTAFRARVRERMTRESVHRAYDSQWTPAVVGSALAVGLAALLWFTPDPGPAVTPPPERELVPSTVAAGASESRPANAPRTSPEVRSERAASPPVAAAVPVDSTPPRASAPAPPGWDSLIVISAGEAAALQRLFREAAAGEVELHVQSLAAEPSAFPSELGAPPLTVDSIAIEPIAVQPLPSIEELGA
jgi:hypothetical protein